MRPQIRRALVKLSGEGLAGPGGMVDSDVVGVIAGELREGLRQGKQIAIVVGGGNILRGSALPVVHRSVADKMGMLATVMNGLALEDAFGQHDLEACVLSAVPVGGDCELFSRQRCIRHLEKGRITILVGGTGNPYFTTDSAAALRANEIDADCLLKATQVDGVYSADPRKVPQASLYRELSFQRAIDEDLKVMDLAAFVLCRDHDLPILVFNLHQRGNLLRALQGEEIGTIVRSES